MQNCDMSSPSIISAARSLLVKLLITLELMVYFDQHLPTYTFNHCLDTGMQNADEASTSIWLRPDGVS